MNKKVFITYSWDNESHKDWVRDLADKLIQQGVEVKLDQYDIAPGDSFTQFMEKSINETDKIIVILTPEYRIKSIERKGGVGYEQQIISGEIVSGIGRRKFIPIICKGSYEDGVECSIPPHFKGISAIDFRTHDMFIESFENLLRTIYETPKLIKPKTGEIPNFFVKDVKPKKSFEIQLSKNFECLQSEIILTDILCQIADLRKDGIIYKITFKIEEISEAYHTYTLLNEKANLPEDDIDKKINIREYLNIKFYKPNGTLYDYLNDALNSIIDFSYNKYKNILNLPELYLSVSKCLSLFDNNSFKSTPKKIGFDVFHSIPDWYFRIGVTQNEVDRFLSMLGVKHTFFLTQVAGLDIYDLSRQTIIEEVIPKQAYSFAHDCFSGRTVPESKNEYFNFNKWRIGLA